MKKALVGLVSAATLSVGLLGVAPAAADASYNGATTPPYNVTGIRGDICALDLYRVDGKVTATNGRVLMAKVAEPQEYDYDRRYTAYMCRFTGLPSYVEETDSGEPYVGPTRRPATHAVSCLSAHNARSRPVVETISGTVKVFKNGTALLKCGIGKAPRR